jgi:hypothetical protein
MLRKSGKAQFAKRPGEGGAGFFTPTHSHAGWILHAGSILEPCDRRRVSACAFRFNPSSHRISISEFFNRAQIGLAIEVA